MPPKRESAMGRAVRQTSKGTKCAHLADVWTRVAILKAHGQSVSAAKHTSTALRLWPDTPEKRAALEDAAKAAAEKENIKVRMVLKMLVPRRRVLQQLQNLLAGVRLVSFIAISGLGHNARHST